MSGIEIIKNIGIILFVLIVGLVQVTFSVIEINGVVPNLVLVLIFGIAFLEVKTRSKLGWRSYGAILGGGLLLDVFSGLPLGAEALMFLVVILIIEQALQFLDRANFLVYIVLFTLMLLLYQLVFNFITFGSFGLNWFGLAYNLILATLFYFLCFLGMILKEK